MTALRLGVCVPLLYFGTQLVVGPLTPDYSLRQQPTSDLGIGTSSQATVFNLGAMATGVTALVAAYGLFASSRWLSVSATATRLASLAVASTAAAAVTAGLFPLPDTRHGGGVIGAGMFVVPFVVALVLWPRASNRLRAYALLNIALFMATGAMLSGATAVDQVANEGLLQRLLAVTVFGAIGVLSATMGKHHIERDPRPGQTPPERVGGLQA